LTAGIGEVSPSFKHYIVTGHDDYVEVIAKDMNWESLGAPLSEFR